MPKPRRPVVKTPVDERLWQIHVRMLDGRVMPFGPRGQKEFLEPLLTQMNGMLSLGKEKRFSDPHLVRVQPIHQTASRDAVSLLRE